MPLYGYVLKRPAVNTAVWNVVAIESLVLFGLIIVDLGTLLWLRFDPNRNNIKDLPSDLVDRQIPFFRYL